MQMLMDLGPVVYVEDFEKHFLTKAAEFYQVDVQEHHMAGDTLK